MRHYQCRRQLVSAYSILRFVYINNTTAYSNGWHFKRGICGICMFTCFIFYESLIFTVWIQVDIASVASSSIDINTCESCTPTVWALPRVRFRYRTTGSMEIADAEDYSAASMTQHAYDHIWHIRNIGFCSEISRLLPFIQETRFNTTCCISTLCLLMIVYCFGPGMCIVSISEVFVLLFNIYV